ncbi:TonB family protein [Aquabacterium fontiphilum]|jgi:protein TonB|uniref:energy transducer TonB n=1 Tax=Aquabacterium fontiphilum TaxID=450365 RepID=UPI001378C95F|nr:energy transducer TonB [Aquabacterium fontiphilum]NBD20826.1 TonB family protein [Aquabacterium fontiphilum]
MLQRLRSIWNQLSLLQVCLTVSAALHIALFSFRFVDPEGFNRTFKDTPLEVILVNAGSETPPEKAQALAQLNLAGGGDATDQRRATTPLPPSAEVELGDALADTARAIERMQREQQALLAQLRQELAALPAPEPTPRSDSPVAQAEEERRKQLSKMLAEIERRIQEENSRPKKRYLSPATLRSADALYYSHFRNLVERAGTDNFPSANGQKLYGELIMEVWLDRQGRVVEAVVLQSSGNPLLDKRAQAIARKAGPFGVVPTEVLAGRDLLLISSRFRFTREAGMQAQTMASPTQPAAPSQAP